MTPPPGLNLCSLAARGLWISAYAIGGEFPQSQLGVITGCSQRQAERLLGELLLRRCAVSSADGVRMVCGSDTSEPTGKQRDWAAIKREQRAMSTYMSTYMSTALSTPMSTAMSTELSTTEIVDSPHVDIVDNRPERMVSLHPSQELLFTTPECYSNTGKTAEEILREAVKCLLPAAYVNAGTFHAGVEGALFALGCAVQREFPVPHRGSRTGRIDLVVTAPVRFAAELDNKISRGGSLKKLAQFDGETFIVLRDGPRILRPGDAISERCIVPEWVPARQWADYIAMRERIRRPMTERAKAIAIEVLARLREAGQAPESVLEQSVFHSWQGLFELKSEVGNGTKFNSGSRATERENRNRANAAASLGVGFGRNCDSGASDGASGLRDDAQPVRRLPAAAGGYPGE